MAITQKFLARLLAALVAAASAASPAAGAQEITADTLAEEERAASNRPFLIVPSVGMQLNDRASALDRASPVLGLDMNYRVSRIFSVGIAGGVARPMTDGDYFSLVELPVGDTSEFYRVSQRVTQFTYGAHALASLPIGRATPYAMAGVGGYTFTMDPQAVGRTRRYSGPSASIGGGVRLPVGRSAGVLLDARDLILLSYERNELDATDPLLRTDKFDPTPGGKPGPRSTIHNVRLSIGVTFVPRGARGGSE